MAAMAPSGAAASEAAAAFLLIDLSDDEIEVVFEALPQSILQAYVAIAYGRLNPSDPEHFSRLLCFSICVSLLGAGATCFGFASPSTRAVATVEPGCMTTKLFSVLSTSAFIPPPICPFAAVVC